MFHPDLQLDLMASTYSICQVSISKEVVNYQLLPDLTPIEGNARKCDWTFHFRWQNTTRRILSYVQNDAMAMECSNLKMMAAHSP
jgi:hypothetical protein